MKKPNIQVPSIPNKTAQAAQSANTPAKTSVVISLPPGALRGLVDVRFKLEDAVNQSLAILQAMELRLTALQRDPEDITPLDRKRDYGLCALKEKCSAELSAAFDAVVNEQGKLLNLFPQDIFVKLTAPSAT